MPKLYGIECELKNKGFLARFFGKNIIGSPSEAYKGLQGRIENTKIKKEGIVSIGITTIIPI